MRSGPARGRAVRLDKQQVGLRAVCSKRSKNWTIAKPKPISAVAVRIHDIIVRSMLRRVRIQLKWLSEVTLTSNLPALGAECGSAMPGSLLLTIHVGAPTA